MTAVVRRIANVTAPGYEIAASQVSPGFASDLVELRLAMSTGFWNPFDHMMNELSCIEAGMRAADSGYDAVLINTVGDYGVPQLRSLLDVPVVGAGQASLSVAAGLGRFGLVTVWPPALKPMYEGLISTYGFERNYVGIRHVTANDELEALTSEDGVLAEMALHGTKKGVLLDRFLDRIEQNCRDLIAAGAEVILLACNCMTGIRDDLAERLVGTVVLDPQLIGYKYTEMLLGLGAQPARPTFRPMLDGRLRAMFAGAGAGLDAGADLFPVCDDICAVLSEKSLEQPAASPAT